MNKCVHKNSTFILLTIIEMEEKELWRDYTYKNLTEEQRIKVLSLIYAYVVEKRLPMSFNVDGKVAEVFLGMMKGLLSWK